MVLINREEISKVVVDETELSTHHPFPSDPALVESERIYTHTHDISRLSRLSSARYLCAQTA